MPLIYIAIYCAIASRLGFNAKPINSPTHVFAVVYPPVGYDLNGKERAATLPPDRTFIDLYSLTTLEISESNLRQMMLDLGTPDSQHEQNLEPASTIKMVIRMRYNLVNCLQRAASAMRNDTPTGYYFNTYREELIYLILWMTMVFDAEDTNAYDRRRSHLQFLLPRLETTYIGDWYLVDEIIIPMFRRRVEEEILRTACNEMRERDLLMPSPKYRTPEIRSHVLFKVGTCFRHKKYGYVGMIVGWDEECMAPSSWQANHRVEDLSDGAKQCFYHVVSDDGTDRYVAQENIGPMPPSGPTEEIIRLAGKFFLRWDKTTKRFANNMKRAYPDD